MHTTSGRTKSCTLSYENPAVRTFQSHFSRAMYFTYSIQRISQDFNSKFWCFYYIHMGSIILHSCMFTALSVIPQLSGKNREILKEKQFRLKDWAPLWIFSDPWNSFFWGFLWWMWKAHRLPTALAGNRTPWTGWLQRSCWVFWPLFQSFFFFSWDQGSTLWTLKISWCSSKGSQPCTPDHQSALPPESKTVGIDLKTVLLPSTDENFLFPIPVILHAMC